MGQIWRTLRNMSQLYERNKIIGNSRKNNGKSTNPSQPLLFLRLDLKEEKRQEGK